MMKKILLTLKRSTLVSVTFTKIFSKRISQNQIWKRELFLNSIVLPNLNSKRFDILESEITEKDLIIALKSMPTSKSPGLDGLAKEFS